MNSIIIEDQFGARPAAQAIILEWKDGVPCTVRDLITERVRLEHERIHPAQGQAQLSPNEIVYLPNSFRHDRITAEEAVRRALDAFMKMGFVVIADGRQMSGLDEVVRLTPATSVRFIKLLPLKGG